MASSEEDKISDRGGDLQFHGLDKSVSAVTMSPEMFEKLYLSPKVPHRGDAIKRYANPTPLGFIGFVMTSSTYALINMGWGGAFGFSPVAGLFLFTGPVLLILASIFEWIMGNFFPFLVFGLFSVFWLSFGLLQLPTLALSAPYASPSDMTGAASHGFNAVVALYLLVWGFAIFTFFIFTLRINIGLALIFGLASVSVFLSSGAFWRTASGDVMMATTLNKASGALLFVVALVGWYMTVAMMAAEMRMGFSLPVGDLSHLWPKTDLELGRTEKRE